MVDLAELRFSELDHNNRILFVTIYIDVMFQLYIVDLRQAELKNKHNEKTLLKKCLVKAHGMAIVLSIGLLCYSKLNRFTGICFC